MTQPVDLEQALKSIFELAKQKRYDEALALGDRLRSEYPDEAKVYAQLGYVHARRGDFDDAVHAITEALDRKPVEPAYLFDRALWQLEDGRFGRAVTDCGSAIEIEQRFGRAYYTGACYFIRALAKRQLGDYQGALDDCNHVADDTVFWALGALQSKKALVDELTKRLGQQA